VVSQQVKTAKERQITTDTSWQGWPDIYMDRVVWTDFRGYNMDIYYCDLGTGQQMRITTNASVQMGPRIFGDIIAWTDYRNGEYPELWGDIIMPKQIDADVFYYNLSVGREIQVTRTGSNQTLADVWGSCIYYYENGDNSTSLYYYDVETGSTHPVNCSGKRIEDVAVHQNRLVYGEVRGPPDAGPLYTVNEDIFLYDLASGEDRRITTNPESQTKPDIFGNYIVWSDWRYHDDDDVADNYLYELSTGQEVKLTTNRDVSYPKVSDQYVVYIQYDKHHRVQQVANESIFAYDIRQGRELPIEVPAGMKDDIEIWGSKIVWSELRDPAHGLPIGWWGPTYNADIYVLDLSSMENEPGLGTCLVSGMGVVPILGVSVIWKGRQVGKLEMTESGARKNQE
jgi:beta propeller repeat protein